MWKVELEYRLNIEYNQANIVPKCQFTTFKNILLQYLDWSEIKEEDLKCIRELFIVHSGSDGLLLFL